jgi:GNAT superfamily N-acetyltransferase
MVNEIFKLFKSVLPEIIRSEETVMKILRDEGNRFITHREDGRLAGAAVINDNTLCLLCVETAFQRKGIGTDLLKQAESYIAARGFDKVILGAGKDYIMPGVPMNNNAHEFFIKRGYTSYWGEHGSFDMAQDLKDFTHDGNSVGDTINDVTYRWANLGDLNGILISLADNEEDFSEFYKNEDFYREGTSKRVLLAESDGEVLGTLFVGAETEREGYGSIGLTATARKHRNKGIATNLVRMGTKYLKEIGMEKAHLGYTYMDLLNLYGRGGYEVCMEYFMGEKRLLSQA